MKKEDELKPNVPPGWVCLGDVFSVSSIPVSDRYGAHRNRFDLSFIAYHNQTDEKTEIYGVWYLREFNKTSILKDQIAAKEGVVTQPPFEWAERHIAQEAVDRI